MGGFRFDRLLDFFAGPQFILWTLWSGLGAITIALIVMMLTRWGNSRTVHKCVVLSLLTHLLLAGYATTVRIVAASQGEPTEPTMRITEVESASGELQSPAEEPGEAVAAEPRKPWDRLAANDSVEPVTVEPERAPAGRLAPSERRRPAQTTRLPADVPLDYLAVAMAPRPDLEMPVNVVRDFNPGVGRGVEPIRVKAPQRLDPPDADFPDKPPRRDDSDRPDMADPDVAETMRQPPPADQPGMLHESPLPVFPVAETTNTPDPQQLLASLSDRFSRPSDLGPANLTSPELTPELPLQTSQNPPATEKPVPPVYRLRIAADREKQAHRHGATDETEAAVAAALKWLAGAQSEDGRWDADAYGAGRESLIGGRDREQAGASADTGVTGLALLAFLASGHTHQRGEYRETVRLGINYLLRTQGQDGSLGGSAKPYAFMYCHAMAAFALSEAFAMTDEALLKDPVTKSLEYTLKAQNVSSGGWRYGPGDPGDTSQLGWQLMALKSGELAGIPIPDHSRQGMIRYLRTVGSGQHGGIAAYRPGEKPSTTMTAEALVCWLFLGMPPDHPAGEEAAAYLLADLPRVPRFPSFADPSQQANLYYWYYATLGLRQLGGEPWRQWNASLQEALVSTQRKSGHLTGTWDPTTRWGGAGGRIYSTALATLCLEVYYRFLPLHAEVASSVPEPQPVEE